MRLFYSFLYINHKDIFFNDVAFSATISHDYQRILLLQLYGEILRKGRLRKELNEMALIKCPNCGKEISNRAATCFGCGYQLIGEPEPEYENGKCQDCGQELEEGAMICPNCGCPIKESPKENKTETGNSEAETGQGTEYLLTKKKGRLSKKCLIIIIAVVVAVAVAGVIIGISVSKTRKEQALQAQQEYASLMVSTIYSIFDGVTDAEDCGNLVKRVWYNSIFEESDSETDRYTQPNGYFVSDFNDALINLFSDSSFSAKISRIKDNQDSVKSGMKQLKYPPAGYEDAYNALSGLYNAYLILSNLVVSPTGNLQTFSSNFNDAVSEMAKQIDNMELYLSD